MRSPFEIFRKHQKVLTVILTGLAMFAFVIFGAIPNPDNISSQPALMAIILAGVLGGAGWIAGINANKSKEWGLTGVLAGLILGIAAVFAVGPQDVVRADTGNIDQQQLNLLIQQRQIANQFVNNAFQRARGSGNQFPPFFRFGHPDLTHDVVVGELLRREADRLGLQVTDAAVNDFIVAVSQGKIGAAAVKEIRDQLGLSEADLYDILRQELKAQRAASLLYSDTMLPPERYWEFYRQMNIQQSVGLVPVPVEAFVNESAEPSETELKELFAKYRVNYPNMTPQGRQDEGRPGFRQPRKVRLAYVEVPYEAVEKTVGEVTDAEIEAFYEEYYKTIPAEEPAGDETGQPGLEAPILPGMKGPEPGPEGQKPAANAAPEPDEPESNPESPEAQDKSKAAPPQKQEEAPPPESAAPPESDSTEKTDNKKPDNQETPQDKSSTKEPQQQDENGASLHPSSDVQLVALFDDEAAAKESPEDETQDSKPPEEPASEETATKTENTPEKPAEQASEGPSQPGGAEDEEEAASPMSPPPPATPRKRETDESQPSGGEASTPDAPGDPPKPRELDDELRGEIRDQILRRRTNERMQELVSEVYDEMAQNLSYFVTMPEDDEQYLTHEEAGERLRAFAEERGLVYGETPLLSIRELRQSEEHPIGRAASDSNLQQSRSVPELAFGASPTELFLPQTVLEIESGSRFVFWKIADQEAYEPTSLDDPGVRRQVVQAWRELQGRDQARQRAEELAQLAEDVDKPLSEIFAETTVTGKDDGQVVSVVHPPRFSWLSQANVSPNPFDRPPPTRTVLRSVPGTVGDEFMETIVSDLQPGEVGVTHNIDKSYYYVVRVDERTYGPAPDFQAFRERFLEEPVFDSFGFSDYARLANEEIRQYDVNWIQELIDRHNADLSGLEQQESESRS